ncbi:Acyltransferase family [Serratia entomophila]|uniref:Acyltransferase n=1 Tax=Serratia entomophila TaxID=42906 RepID=A0ABY5CTF9_9GAMM|nr:acyltransferase [Serratia entomophila]UIW18792.1 acyltransferase [Serratia entomophila]USV01439.1 acyltransferase [Serratia entomophila]CAI0769704.1 Acyltransferase family [Serratia entomophila]CAI0782707.1 Acyltransferase family [Serratia entomophila]CAI0805412.1 Acyltransferase family [Serratia entomophila]
MNISIEKSNYLKGIAIILMLVHHLFAFPDRISPDVTVKYIGMLPGTGMYIETYIGLFGKICVSMFLFLSGYGFSLRREVSAKYIYGKLKNLYISYWLVLFIFFSIGIVFYSGARFSTSIPTFLENFIGIKSTYNGEWWFFKLYVLYVLSLPLFVRLNNYAILVIVFLGTGIGKVLSGYDFVPTFITDYLIWLLPFGLGIVFGRAGNFPETSFISKMLRKVNGVHAIWLFILTIIAFVGGKGLGLVLATPFFILALVKVSDKSNAKVNGVISELGRNSMYMWLTHTFYCYHFAPKVIYYPEYTPLILILLIVISYLTSLVLTRIEQFIKKPFELKANSAG